MGDKGLEPLESLLYHRNGHNPYSSVDDVDKHDTKPTRKRNTWNDNSRTASANKRWGAHWELVKTVKKDPAFQFYLDSRGHTLAENSIQAASSGVVQLLYELNLPITPTALTELIDRTRNQHRQDDFSLDRSMVLFGKKGGSHPKWGSFIKSIFEAMHCPLTASMPQQKTRKEKRISAGILKGIYDSLPRRELQLLTDLCAFCAERVSAVCTTPFSAWEDTFEKYTIIRFDPEATKVNYDHIGIIPRRLADEIRNYAKPLERTCPFPNWQTLWREITILALKKFGLRFTSKSLRKEYVAKAKKTVMPPNDWDFLAGHKQKVGNQAHHYDPEDDPTLIREYDQYLSPYLGMWNTREPDEAGTPFKNEQVELLRTENAELKARLDQLMQLLTSKLNGTSQVPPHSS